MTDHGLPHTRLLILGVGLVAFLLVFMVSGAVSLDDETNAQVAQQSDGDGFEGMIDLENADATYLGEAANDSAGWDVARAGDVNGDGVDDLLIGAPMNDSAGDNAGAAYVVYGPADPAEVDLSDADVKLTGVAPGDFAGWSVSTAGDLNDDGYADIVVGAQGRDIEPTDESSTGNNAGAAYVVYGDEYLSGEVSLADANVTLTGSEEYDHAGWAVGNASAVGEDGNPGIIVGAPDVDAEVDNAGAAYFIANDSLEQRMDLETDADARLTGISPGARAGSAVSNAGDVNGDGVGDVVVGAPGHNVSVFQSEPAGAAYVVPGPVDERTDLRDAGMTLEGANAGDEAGFAVSSAGDLNNDTYADVVIGAPGSDAGGNQSGAAHVVYGSEEFDDHRNLSNANVTLVGEAEQDQAGWSVSSAGSGDVTCDGVDDVLVGAPFNDTGGLSAGAAYLVEGSPSLNDSINLSDADAKFVGEERGDWAGWAVAEAGDHDNDTFEDVLIGAPYNDSTADNAGAAYVVESNCEETPIDERTPEETTTPTETPTETETPDKPKKPDDVMDDEETDTPTDGAAEPPTDTPTEEPPTKEPPTEEPPEPEEPNLDVVSECTDDGAEVTVTLNNPDDVEYPVDVQFHVQGDDVANVTLAEGETTVTTGLDLNATELDEGRMVDVSVNGDQVSDLQLTVQCDLPNEDPSAVISAAPDELEVGEEGTFDASGSSDEDGSITSYEWDFDDGTNNTGETVTHNYTSTGTYEVTLTVTDDEGATDSATTTVEVVEADAELESIDLALEETELDVGNTTDYNVTANYNNGTSVEVTDQAAVTSDNASIASVDEPSASVIAQGAGEATITAEFDGESDQVDVTVAEPEADLESIELDLDQTDLEVDDTTDYTLTANYDDGTEADVTGEASVTSDDAGIASVDEPSASVIAQGAGEATITAEFDGASDEVDVNVTEPEPELESINLELTETELDVGNTTDYTVTASYDNGSDVDVTDEADVTSDDASIASVDEGSSSVIAQGAGEATITAEFDGASDEVDVNVAEPEAELDSIDLQLDETDLEVNDTTAYTVMANHDDGTTADVTGDASVTSDDAGIASVDEPSASVIAQGAGEATITADYEEISDQVEVNVTDLE